MQAEKEKKRIQREQTHLERLEKGTLRHRCKLVLHVLVYYYHMYMSELSVNTSGVESSHSSNVS